VLRLPRYAGQREWARPQNLMEQPTQDGYCVKDFGMMTVFGLIQNNGLIKKRLWRRLS
jgi:hypothetical protein